MLAMLVSHFALRKITRQTYCWSPCDEWEVKEVTIKLRTFNGQAAMQAWFSQLRVFA